jgi:hypothetical protein
MLTLASRPVKVHGALAINCWFVAPRPGFSARAAPLRRLVGDQPIRSDDNRLNRRLAGRRRDSQHCGRGRMRLIQSYVRAVSNCSPLSRRAQVLMKRRSARRFMPSLSSKLPKRFADRSEVLNDPDHTGRQHVDALSPESPGAAGAESEAPGALECRAPKEATDPKTLHGSLLLLAARAPACEGFTGPLSLAGQVCCPAASRIRRVISSGCEISERWLAFTSIVLASIRLAMKRSRSGLMVRSSVETA